MDEDDRQPGRARRSGRRDVIHLQYPLGENAGEPGDDGRNGDPQRYDRRSKAGPVARRHHQHGEQQSGKRDQDIERRRQRVVERPGREGSEDAQRHPDGRADRHGPRPHLNGDARPDHDVGEQIPPQPIGARPMGQRWPLEPHARHVIGPIGRPEQRQKRQGHMDADQNQPDDQRQGQARPTARADPALHPEDAHWPAPLFERRSLGSISRWTISATNPTRSTMSVEISNTP